MFNIIIIENMRIDLHKLKYNLLNKMDYWLKQLVKLLHKFLSSKSLLLIMKCNWVIGLFKSFRFIVEKFQIYLHYGLFELDELNILD